jgi:excisionase family DNA binding protein
MQHPPSTVHDADAPLVSPFYTTQEVARLLKVDQTTVQGWIRDGLLRGVRFGRLWRVRHADLAAFGEEGPRHTPRADADARPSPQPAGAAQE